MVLGVWSAIKRVLYFQKTAQALFEWLDQHNPKIHMENISVPWSFHTKSEHSSPS